MKTDKPDGIQTPPHATRFERIDTAGGPVILCNPTRPQLRQWRSMAMKVDGDMGQAYETLFLATWCGDPKDAMKLLDEWPGVCTSGDVLAAMNRLAGITNEEAGKS